MSLKYFNRATGGETQQSQEVESARLGDIVQKDERKQKNLLAAEQLRASTLQKYQVSMCF